MDPSRRGVLSATLISGALAVPAFAPYTHATSRPRSPTTAVSAASEDRERYMRTRMREHQAATGTDPADCLHACGAFHAVGRVAEFGVHGTDTFEISARSDTK